MWENSLFGAGKQASLLLAEGAQMAGWGSGWHSVVEAVGWSPRKVTAVRDHVTVIHGVQPVRLTVLPACASCSLPFSPILQPPRRLPKSPHSKAQLGCHLPHEALPKLL